ncbi:MAG: YqgE/AlgH family protein [Candidatus Pacebacteria bacterium]|nr:YqgE/AlgH family protein [Candidatus Paceibacterota bacterium]
MNGRLLIAMPQLNDKRFHRAVIFICMHREDGAMGIVINRLVGGITYGELMRQLGIELDANSNDRPVHFGGPVEPSRGFVLHSPDRVEENTVLIEGYGLTSTTDILRAIHKGEGPNRNILALGYAGWGPGQLDSELRQNSWLAVNPDEALVFDLDFDTKWERAIAKLGVDFAMLSTEAGHA